MAANPQYAEGEVIANKYVVEGLIGESPAAKSYLANGNAGKLVVKMYRQDLSSRLLTAPDFFLKAGVMTEIEHDNLCACVDVQEEMGLIFVARAYGDGLTFEEWARKHRGDANYFSRGLELLWQTCQGLTTLHERTRHLNIHPGNIIVGPLVAKLCDWDPRSLGNTEMTPEPLPGRQEYQGYRAPEAAGRNGFLSYPSTDLFAVAGVLYRMVKGEHPSVNPAQTLSEVRSLDKDLAGFLSKALAPRPEDRFQDASAFSDALWELGGAMQRLQERGPRGPQPAPRREEPLFPDPPTISLPEPDFAANPGTGSVKTKAEDDSFFNFFPPPDPAPASKAQALHNPVQPAVPAASGDTLFGAPSFVAPQAEPPRPARPVPAYVPPRAEPRYEAPSPSGLSDLEAPGTLFGSQAPLFSSTGSSPKTPSRNDPPPKPIAVSLSSLEKDPLEIAGSGEPGGFTAYGFKGAGDNRTGIYSPESKAADAKRKLRILLGTVGALLLIFSLVALFIYLRGNAAHKDVSAEATEPAPLTPDPYSQETATPTATSPEPMHAQPTPEANAEPVAAPAGKTPAPDPVSATANNGYSEPPMPVEPPRPGETSGRPATLASSGTTSPAKPPVYKGNSHVTPEREAALMAMVQNRSWPNSAAERLKAADELNDLAKTAEANMAYSKVLLASDVSEKQKISAYGGLAVTFQSMGMRDQARDAVQQILDINPRNAFALKLKEKLK
jgi:serine/threonine protein kinase